MLTLSCRQHIFSQEVLSFNFANVVHNSPEVVDHNAAHSNSSFSGKSAQYNSDQSSNSQSNDGSISHVVSRANISVGVMAAYPGVSSYAKSNTSCRSSTSDSNKVQGETCKCGYIVCINSFNVQGHKSDMFGVKPSIRICS